MNIWITTTLFPPVIGGAERMSATLAAGLAARGHQVTVVTRHHDPALPRTELIGGYRVRRVGIQGGKYPEKISFLTNATALMLPHLGSIDVIHAHQMFSPTMIGAALTAIGRPKLVVTAHRGGPEGDVGLMRNKTLGPQRMEVYRRLADAFVVISSEIRRELSSIGVAEDRLHDIPNGVDTVAFHPVDEVERVATAERLGLPTEGRNVVFAGRLTPIKGLDTLFESVPLLDDDINVIVGGAGELAPWVESVAGGPLAGRVVAIGPREDMPDVLRACHAWVLPSRGEGLPLSLLEAMSAGLAVVATDVGGIPEVLSDGVNGVLVRPDDPAALAAGIRRALADRERLTRAARALVVEDFSAETMVIRHEKLFASLTGSV